MSYNSDGQLRGGTLHALVIRLTSHERRQSLRMSPIAEAVLTGPCSGRRVPTGLLDDVQDLHYVLESLRSPGRALSSATAVRARRGRAQVMGGTEAASGADPVRLRRRVHPLGLTRPFLQSCQRSLYLARFVPRRRRRHSHLDEGIRICSQRALRPCSGASGAVDMRTSRTWSLAPEAVTPLKDAAARQSRP